MDIKKFTIAASSCPRYGYISVETVRFYKRFNVLLKKTELNSQDYPIPKYEDPTIFVIHDKDDTSFTESCLQPKHRQSKVILHQVLSSLDGLRKENITSTSEKIVILFSSDFSETLAWVEEFALNSIVLNNSDENAENLRGKYTFLDRNSVPVIVIEETNELAEAIDVVLERIVFRRLYLLLEVLKDFKEIEKRPFIAGDLRHYLQGYLNSIGREPKRILRGWMEEINTMSVQTEEQNIRKVLQALDITDENRITKNKPLCLLLNQICLDMSKKMEQFIHDQVKRIPYNIRDMLPELIDIGAIEEHLYKIIINFLAKSCQKEASEEEEEEYMIPDDLIIIEKQLRDNGTVLIETVEDVVNKMKIVTEVDRRIQKIKDLYESSFHRIAWEIKGSYYRSKVPLGERPSSRNENKTLSPKVTRRLFDKVTGAVGVGYRCDKLHVYIRENSDMNESEVQSDVKKVLDEFHITDFRLILSKETVTHFKRVGEKIKVARKGTLGGFAWMNVSSRGNEQTVSRRTSEHPEVRQLCALLSKHVVNGADQVYWLPEKSNDEIRIGSVIQVREMPSKQSNPYVDIAAAKILSKEENNCDRKFRNSKQQPCLCKLFDFNDKHYLQGLTVHFSGATTKLGIGKITDPDFICPSSGNPQGEGHYVIIEDIEEDEEGHINRFSEEGDSGAVICADTMDGEHVDVIAMLIGCMNFSAREDKNIPGKYLAFRMKDGLEKLKTETKCNFMLCTE